eukprot:1194851-Prorocentrum_minimum.AAC.1
MLSTNVDGDLPRALCALAVVGTGTTAPPPVKRNKKSHHSSCTGGTRTRLSAPKATNRPPKGQILTNWLPRSPPVAAWWCPPSGGRGRPPPAAPSSAVDA